MDGNDGHHLGGGVSAPRALVAVLGRRASAPPAAPADPGVPNSPTPTPTPTQPPTQPPASATAPSRIRPMLMTAAAVCVIAASLTVIGWVHGKAGSAPSGGTYAVVETPPNAVTVSPPNIRTSPQPLVPLLPPDRKRDPRPAASASRPAAPSATATPRAGAGSATGPAGAISGYLGKCLNVPGGNTAEGIPVEMAACDENPGERWIMASDGTIRMAGKCVTVMGDQTTNGTAVRLSACTGVAGQQWRFSPGRDLVNPHADKCLDVKDFDPGDSALLQLWSCTGSANQKWAVPA
jgi:ricin-type beta-trefoil lectin protein